jgi:hypothetical protein
LLPNIHVSAPSIIRFHNTTIDIQKYPSQTFDEQYTYFKQIDIEVRVVVMGELSVQEIEWLIDEISNLKPSHVFISDVDIGILDDIDWSVIPIVLPCNHELKNNRCDGDSWGAKTKASCISAKSKKNKFCSDMNWDHYRYFYKGMRGDYSRGRQQCRLTNFLDLAIEIYNLESNSNSRWIGKKPLKSNTRWNSSGGFKVKHKRTKKKSRRKKY